MLEYANTAKLPFGWDYCSWEEADAVLCPNGTWFKIETKKNHGLLDSFKIYFEPGESEIGILQAEDYLSLLPIKKNAFFGLENEEELSEEQIVKVDYEYIKNRTASDLRKVAQVILETAGEVSKGDLEAFEILIEEQLLAMIQILSLRYSYLRDNKGKTINLNEDSFEEDEI